MRTTLAFLIAPLSVPLAAIVLLKVADIPIELPGFILISGLVAYMSTLVLGVPAFLMFEARGFQSLYAYLIGGLVLASLPAMLFGFLLESLLIFGVILFAGALEAILFQAIRGTTVRKG